MLSEAVSYTHLDVYKRQVLHLAPQRLQCYHFMLSLLLLLFSIICLNQFHRHECLSFIISVFPYEYIMCYNRGQRGSVKRTNIFRL